jgi:hypothetical protein
MFLVQQKINEATPKSHKRSLDTSPSTESNMNKKHAAAFSYDKSKHVYESELMRRNEYGHDRADNIYKVNVRRSNGDPINRIGLMKLLTGQNVENIITSKKISWNTIGIHFSTREDANSFTKLGCLTDSGYVAFIPIYYRSVVGVIRDIPSDMDAKEIYDEINENNDILKIERMTRRLRNGHRDYSLNIKITFNNSTIPRCVSIFHGLEKVEPYIPPLLLCRGCGIYGHQVNSCKSPNKLTCQRCNIEGHERGECTATRPTCMHCKGPHEANSKECIERKRQENIRILMSGKNLSYKEVLEQFPNYTSKNQFNLLENLEEFPTLERRSYRDQLVGKKKKIIHSERRPRKIFTAKKPEVNSAYYALHTHPESCSKPVLDNKNRVDEVEREISKISQQKAKKQYANEDSICELFNASASSSVDSDSIKISLKSEDHQLLINLTEEPSSI